MDSSESIFHTEGDKDDVLFTMPSLSRTLSEGDEFVYTDDTNTIRYKIESVEYHLRYTDSPSTEILTKTWKAPICYFGVKVVV